MLDNFSKDGALEEQYLFGGVSVDLFSWLVECVKRKLVVDKVSERPDRASAMISANATNSRFEDLSQRSEARHGICKS